MFLKGNSGGGVDLGRREVGETESSGGREIAVGIYYVRERNEKGQLF